MNYVNLPDLRHIVRGFGLRVDAARAISHVETAARNGADVSNAAQSLGDFFTACAQAAYAAAGITGNSAPAPKPKK